MLSDLITHTINMDVLHNGYGTDKVFMKYVTACKKSSSGPLFSTFEREGGLLIYYLFY